MSDQRGFSRRIAALTKRAFKSEKPRQADLASGVFPPPSAPASRTETSSSKLEISAITSAHEFADAPPVHLDGLNRAKAHQIYSALEPGFIRTVTLRKGKDDDAIACSLNTVKLSDRPRYTPISYVWGSKTGPGQIFLNDCVYFVTANLWNALKHLRRQEEDSTLWIDAVCINQLDIPEREDQVRFMGEIFSNANEVFSWIGNDAKLERAVRRLSRPDGLADDLLAEVSLLTQNEYWSRTWILQEAFQREKVRIWCGRSSARYLIFQAHVERLVRRVYFHVQQDDSALRYWQHLSQFLEVQTKASSENVVEDLFKAVVSRSCADLRDQVYAIRALLPENLQKRIQVDYNIPVRQLYLNVAEAIVEWTNRLDLITWNSMHNFAYDCERSGAIGLPTWAPCWTTKAMSSEQIDDPIIRDFRALSASSRHEPPGTIQTVSVLKVRGTQIGNIKEMLPSIPVSWVPDKMPQFSEWVPYLRSWYNRMESKDSNARRWFFETCCGNGAVVTHMGKEPTGTDMKVVEAEEKLAEQKEILTKLEDDMSKAETELLQRETDLLQEEALLKEESLKLTESEKSHSDIKNRLWDSQMKLNRAEPQGKTFEMWSDVVAKYKTALGSWNDAIIAFEESVDARKQSVDAHRDSVEAQMKLVEALRIAIHAQQEAIDLRYEEVKWRKKEAKSQQNELYSMGPLSETEIDLIESRRKWLQKIFWAVIEHKDFRVEEADDRLITRNLVLSPARGHFFLMEMLRSGTDLATTGFSGRPLVIGRGPRVLPGDIVCKIAQCSGFVILRPTASSFKVVGEAQVYTQVAGKLAAGQAEAAMREFALI